MKVFSFSVPWKPSIKIDESKVWPWGQKVMTLTKICWHLIAPKSTLDFSGKLALNLDLGLNTSYCSWNTACWRSARKLAGWGEGPWAIATPLKLLRGEWWICSIQALQSKRHTLESYWLQIDSHYYFKVVHYDRRLIYTIGYCGHRTWTKLFLAGIVEATIRKVFFVKSEEPRRTLTWNWDRKNNLPFRSFENNFFLFLVSVTRQIERVRCRE